MYTTHGDMIIFRPNQTDHVLRTARSTRYRDGWADRTGDRRGGRSDERWTERTGRVSDGRTAETEGLRERVAELEARVSRLEARVSRLEARLERLGDHRRERLYDPDVSRDAAPERRPPRRRREARPVEPPQVRVSLQADGNAQASLGEVRLITDD